MSESNIKVFNSKLTNITQKLDGLTKEDHLTTDTKNKIFEIKEIVSTIEVPTPKCPTCNFLKIKEGANYKKYSCKLKNLPKKYKNNEAVSSFGCTFHSEI